MRIRPCKKAIASSSRASTARKMTSLCSDCRGAGIRETPFLVVCNEYCCVGWKFFAKNFHPTQQYSLQTTRKGVSLMPAPLQSEHKEVILRAVEALEDEAIAFLQGLIRIPTVNPPGRDYPACAHYIGERLRSLGYEVEYIDLTPEEVAELAPYGEGLPRTNVIGRLHGPQTSPVMHF